MTTLEELEEEAREKGLRVIDLPLEHTDGLCCGDLIGIRSGQTTAEKTCVLAEELAHAELTVGDITDQTDVRNRKQELAARAAAYDRLIGIHRLIDALRHGYRRPHEIAEYLEVTEEFLMYALAHYREKFG